MDDEKSRKVLIVDGERPALRDLFGVLTRAGFSIRCARGDREALRMLEGEEFDVILLNNDLKILERGGIRLIPEFMRRSSAPVIVHTETPDDEGRRAAMRIGAADYLVMPTTPNVLLWAIRKALFRGCPLAPASLNS